MRSYNKFKKIFKTEPYLINQSLYKYQKIFRLSTHRLRIEKARYNSKNNYVPPEDRLCPNCHLHTNDWLESYLSNRTQFVEIDDMKSSYQHAPCGVPQGSIIGPLLYLIYVNDIWKSCDSKIFSFADNTTLCVSSPNLDDLYDTINNDINKMHTWFCANRLSLNAKKTKYIVIRPKHKSCDLTDKQLVINDVPLCRIGTGCKETSTKFLGILLDEHITWKQHVSLVNSKISRAIFSINQAKNILPYSILRKLYYALIQPHLTYGILAWGNADQSILRKTITLQKRAIRTIHKSTYNSHTDPLFNTSQILKISDLYQSQIALFMYDYIHHKLPGSFENVFLYQRDVQTTYETRQSDKLYILGCKSNFAMRLPLIAFPKIWNKWSPIYSSCTSRSKFKKCIEASCLLTYPSQVAKCSNKRCLDCYSNAK